MARTHTPAVVVCFVGLSALACGDSDVPGLPLDAAAIADLGASADAAAPADVGTPFDDAGIDDGGPAADLGSTDVGVPVDLGPTDVAGPADAEPIDLGPTDAAPGDAGPADAAPGDLGPSDVAPSDASPGDASPGDAGPGDVGLDAGSGDAGTAPTCNPAFGQTPPTCGGNPAGNWRFREACGTPPLQMQLVAQCPTASLSNLVRTATGTLSLQGTSYTLQLTDVSSADLTIPPLCAIPAGGCAGIPALLAQAGASGTCTTLANNGCDCAVTARTTRNETGSFTQNGATITAGANTYDHCVTGTASLEVRERASGSVYVLTP